MSTPAMPSGGPVKAFGQLWVEALSTVMSQVASAASADLLLDGRVVARGEVVVVERNFGIRITEVLPKQAQV